MPTMMRNAAVEAISQVLERLELAYKPGADGTATLFLDGLRIQLAPCENKLRFEFTLGNLPTDAWARENKLFEIARIAAGNLANMDTNQETVTISENTLEILLFRTVAADQLEVDRCLHILAQFVDAAEYWQRAVAR